MNNKIKMFKILNISAAAGLVEKVNDKTIAKPNNAYNKVSLAPSWGAAVMWADTLAELSSIRIPEDEKWVFIGEVELDPRQIVEGSSDALHLDETEFVKMRADRAVSRLTYKGWTYGPYNDFYGIRPEVRVDGPVEIIRIYKIKKELVRNLIIRAPSIDHEMEEMNMEYYMGMSDEEYEKMKEEEERHMEKWISEFHQEVKNLKKSLIPSSYKEMMESLYMDIEVNERFTKGEEVPVSSWDYSDPTRFLAGIIILQNGGKINEWGRSAPFLSLVLKNSYPVQFIDKKEYEYYDSNTSLLLHANELPDAVELLRKYRDPLKVLEELEKHL